MSSYTFDALNIDPATGLPKKKAAASGLNNDAFMRALANGAPPPTGGTLPSFGGQPALPQTPPPPDYAGLINKDPLFTQFKADLSAQGIQDATARGSQIARLLGLFGQVPEAGALSGLNPEWLAQDITPQVRQIAEQNTASGMSLVARQQKAFTDQVRAIKNSLAARGALRSGELGHQLQEAQTARDTARFDSTEELTRLIAGIQQGFADSQRQRQMQSAQAAEAAAGRVQQQYQAQPGSPQGSLGASAPVGSSPTASPDINKLFEASRRKSNEYYGF